MIHHGCVVVSIDNTLKERGLSICGFRNLILDVLLRRKAHLSLQSSQLIECPLTWQHVADVGCLNVPCALIILEGPIVRPNRTRSSRFAGQKKRHKWYTTFSMQKYHARLHPLQHTYHANNAQYSKKQSIYSIKLTSRTQYLSTYKQTSIFVAAVSAQI